METRKLTKEELGAIVAFPRTQLRGIGCEDKEQMPARQDFTLREVQDVPGMGTVKLIEQVGEPEMVFQLIEAKDEAEFDRYLGTLLGMHQSPIYVEGRLDFIVLFQGCKDDIEANQQNYKEKVQLICNVRDQAARWWHLYGVQRQDITMCCKSRHSSNGSLGFLL